MVSLLSLFFPSRCIGCGAPVSALCASCAEHIPLAVPTASPRTYAVFAYEHRVVERAIRALKYYHREEAALALLRYGIPHIIEWLGETLQSATSETLILVPIPQHTAKTRERGFNQSNLLARELAKHIEGALVHPLIEKHRKTLPQAKTRRKHERLSNIAHSMRCMRELDPHALYLLVDDVTTTGATFSEAARALRASGAKTVLGVALAHGSLYNSTHFA